MKGLCVTETDPESLYVSVFGAEAVWLVLRLSAAEPVYVVVTVSVTPVGNVVILGVPVLSREAVTDLDTVVVEHLDPVADGLADLDRVVSPDGL